MSRRSRATVRTVEPEHLYGSVLLARLINKVMKHGKKSLARKIVYSVLSDIRRQAGLTSDEQLLEFVEKAVDNASPQISLKSRRIGGATYQVPVALSKHKSESLGIKWIVHFAEAKKGESIVKSLSSELWGSFNENGAAYKKKVATHKMADANKAFASKASKRT